ncbi:ABC transporter substrate-binding protein [Sphingomonas sp. LY54]|uniref:ABC transporter substrate-binding protein n=1 Tax=Sphingomonas sp. LY54 TaxID=3095343 RepID=UPI002D782ECD|nr:ABC transporter substrate-binding protein [Sphingomonas sp. LY54]WRP28872.1 ABC transporter substrate-binding protein [Sphingomonas sp. LY54]
MRAFACILAASLALSGAAEAAPTRVASLNLCTDELLLALAAPGQIASVTHLSSQEAETPLWRQARRYQRNDGSLLSVAGFRPDLVLTMGGGARDRTRIARRLGIRVLDLPFPASIADTEQAIMTVAAALGREAEGRRMLTRISALKRSQPASAADTIWLGGGGRSVGANSLAAQWMRLAGFRQRPLRGDRVSLEQLLVRPPAILLRSDYRSGQYSGEQRWLAHPLARGTRRSRAIPTDGRRWTCMGPLMIDEVQRLRKMAP